jgi:hypothetical protein
LVNHRIPDCFSICCPLGIPFCCLSFVFG